jgi:hypothetical protein
VTPSFVPETFERVMGCTSAELVSWLPRALPDAHLQTDVAGQRNAASWAQGKMELNWQPLPPRRIALLEIPQLAVRFTYSDLSATERYRIQKCFDLQTHRGGG